MQSAEEQKRTEIIPVTGRIEPAPAKVFDIEGALSKMEEWELVKKRLLKDKDVVKRSDGSAFPNKGGCNKLAMAGNVAITVVRWEWDPPGIPGIIPVEMEATATVVVRAVTSWGRWTEQMGTYSASEYVEYVDRNDKSKGKHRVPVSRHNVLARAETRATNRSILRLIGGGEVSAEEVGVFSEEDEVPEEKEGGGKEDKVQEKGKGEAPKEEPELLKRIKQDVKDFDVKVVEGADWYGVVPSAATADSHEKMDALGKIMSTYAARKDLQGGKTIWKVKK